MASTARMVTLIANDTDGHRREYISLFIKIFFDRKHHVQLAERGWPYFLSRNPLLFLMIEDGPLDFAVTALLRAFLFRRTVGLLFRPEECVVPRTMRLRIKRACLRLLKALPRCSVVTILPFQTNPAFAHIARYGIYDPQLWDVEDLWAAVPDDAQHDGLTAQIRGAARGRKICVALGSQNLRKGFWFFCDIWRRNSDVRKNYLFVSGGRISEDLAALGHDFTRAGGLVFDRLLTDSEMVYLYACADVVWSCYPPEYNQASGIFGRAVQNGVPSIVRTGSNVHSVAAEIGHPIIAIPWGDATAASAALQTLPERREKRLVNQSIGTMRSASIETIANALGLAGGTIEQKG